MHTYVYKHMYVISLHIIALFIIKIPLMLFIDQL